MPFGGTLDPNNRWVIYSSLMPWEELEEAYDCQFISTTGAPAKPVKVAFGALFIKQRLGLSDEETVEEISENSYMHVPRVIDSSRTLMKLSRGWESGLPESACRGCLQTTPCCCSQKLWW